MNDKTNSGQIVPEQIIELWKGMYFRAQAGMERYLVTNFGFSAINEWIDYTSEISSRQAKLLTVKSTVPFIRNLELIMTCWGSRDVEVKQIEDEQAEIYIDGCGILAYRKNAREMGIELTFDDPCREYCTKLLQRIADKQGLEAQYELEDGGCVWRTRIAQQK
ncbi:MAG: hypothetical protein ACM3QW_09720 [Ignavibacteriales bacterium]